MDNEVETGGNRWRYPQGFKVNIRKFPSASSAGGQSTVEANLDDYKKMDRKKAAEEICKHIEFWDFLPGHKSHFYKNVRHPIAQQWGAHRRSVDKYLTKRRPGKNQLVVAPKLAYGTATELCESWNSSGPDYVNIEEGMFCSIETKTLYPICGKEGVAEDALCFDVEKEALVHGKTATLVPRQETYKNVMRWGQ